jgi:hypothetical protein
MSFASPFIVRGTGNMFPDQHDHSHDNRLVICEAQNG